MTSRKLPKMVISESFSYVLLTGIVGRLIAGTLGMILVEISIASIPVPTTHIPITNISNIVDVK